MLGEDWGPWPPLSHLLFTGCSPVYKKYRGSVRYHKGDPQGCKTQWKTHPIFRRVVMLQCEDTGQ